MELSPCDVVVLLSCLTSSILVQSQDQSGFISLACGSPKGESYIDSNTNITYISDSDFIETGETMRIGPQYSSMEEKQYWHVRSFPDGVRNCYSLNLSKGDKYLIMVAFVFGDYNGPEDPEFELHLGTNLWERISARALRDGGTPYVGPYRSEMLHALRSDRLDVCLVRTGSTVPFLSALELRRLKNTPHVTQAGSLVYKIRQDIGSTPGPLMRFSDDPFDRIWDSYKNESWPDWSQISTTRTVNTDDDYRPPKKAMRTAAIPKDPDQPMNISVKGDQIEVYMHVAEIRELKSNESCEFEVLCNGKHLYGPFSPMYLNTTTINVTTKSVDASADGQYNFSLRRTGNSTMPPLLNALEVYHVHPLPQPETEEKDVSGNCNDFSVNALIDTKRTYKLNKISWQGDPCVPARYRWDNLGCTDDQEAPPRITSLNLSSSGLIGEIASSISNFDHLEILDLSNNDLIGGVPEFLAQMTTLRVINLNGNKLNGSVPTSLLERAKRGSLSFRAEGNQDLCTSANCNSSKKKKDSILVPAIASAASVLALGALVAASFIIRCRKRNTHQNFSHNYESPLVIKRKRLTYSELARVTNNFQRVLGRGGFGVVYHGVLEEVNQVAVKMLTQPSIQGYKQFKTEVELLMRVHHRNLTRLVGYCDDNNKIALIYEFMANGDLKEHLSGRRGPNTLGWEARLRIETEAAQGLEYLHKGCSPPIIHRDVKSTNILLNEHFQAKLSDFGLSRSFSSENEAHVSTTVAGTPGFLDPEYYRTNWLTEKSDVYSFGIMLLEMITNRAVIDQSRQWPLISEWVKMTLHRGDIMSIIDPKLHGNFDIASGWKAIEIAMKCVNPSSAGRPTMPEVVMDLNECLKVATLKNQRNHGAENANTSSVEVSLNFTTDIEPEAR